MSDDKRQTAANQRNLASYTRSRARAQSDVLQTISQGWLLLSAPRLLLLLPSLGCYALATFCCKRKREAPFAERLRRLTEEHAGRRSLLADEVVCDSVPPPAPPIRQSRASVLHFAWLAEHLMHYDMQREPRDAHDHWDFDPDEPTAAETLRGRLRCRESAPFFAPDKVGELKGLPLNKAAVAQCEVLRRRSLWMVEFRRHYKPVLLEWIDTGVGRGKQVALLLLRPAGA